MSWLLLLLARISTEGTDQVVVGNFFANNPGVPIKVYIFVCISRSEDHFKKVLMHEMKHCESIKTPELLPT